MDANWHLYDLRRLADNLYYGGVEYRNNPAKRRADAERLAELFRELDRWMSGGNPPPTDWSKHQ